MDKLSLKPIGVPAFVPALPEEAPSEMPAQRLDAWDGRQVAPRLPFRWGVALWRLFVFGGTLALTAGAGWGLYEALTVREITELQVLLLILFVPNFAWIALWCMNGIAGFIALCFGCGSLATPRPSGPLASRTALLFPVYNETPARVLANVEAMRETLIEAGALDAFDFFILSDSTDASVWLAEEAGFRELRRRLGDDARVYYRHRSRNVARKAGNIADFCRRWGGHYDFMAVLDADSLMTGDVLVRLAAAMERRPEAGLIQTAPAAINGVTLFARLQQFASNAFGPLIAAGLDRWFGGDGSYWGHNAIVRTRAFIDHAGLPPLKGRKPFGGHILSHDFVEAALLRRAGWQIYMVPGLGGSFEESPPSLIDYASRDRRWCQGNMQHLAVLPTRGLAAMSRLHLALGIWSYLASPCWLVFLLVGVLLALQAEFIRPEYFTREFGLFPTWPVINPKLAAWLFGGTMAVLLAPRVLGLIWLWRSGRVSAGFGGRLAALASTVIEVLLSSLAAPVLMLTQTQAVIGILAGRDVGWKAQRREGGGAPFSEVLERHWGHTLSGLLLAGAVYQVTPILLAWMSPLALGLVLAIPLSLACASPAVGTALRRWRLLSTPPERMPPPLLRRAAELRGSYEAAIADRRDCLARLAGDSELRNFHLGLLPAEPMPRRGEVDVDLVVALAKIDQCETVRQAAELLAPREAYAVLGSTQGITRLMRLARDARPQVASAPR